LKKKEKIYEGKGKKVYKTDDDGHIILEFKDDAAAYHDTKKGKTKGKGITNNKLSSMLFKYLESYNIPTHYVELLSDRESLVRKAEVIQINVMIRNIATGDFCNTFGIEDGSELNTPVLEYSIKDDKMGSMLINEYHAVALNIATKLEMSEITKLTIKCNSVLKSFFERRDIKLVDFKLEFGRVDEGLVLTDEVSPDTCRLVDINTNKKLANDRFSQDLLDIAKSPKKEPEKVEE